MLNKSKLFMFLGSALLLGACTPKEVVTTQQIPVADLESDNTDLIPKVQDTTEESPEIEDTTEKSPKIVMTSTILEEYMEDSEYNKLYLIKDQKYLSPNEQKILTYNTENGISMIEILTVADGYISEPNVLDLTDYLSPYDSDDKGYIGRLLNAGWYSDEEIFITTTLQLTIHNLTDGTNTIISADFRPTYDEHGTFKFIDWLQPANKVGNYLVYQGVRPLEFGDTDFRIFLADKGGEEMILEGYSLVASNGTGFAYVDNEGHADELWWYDIATKESSLLYELDIKLDGDYPTSKEYIGYFNNMTKQDYYEKPEFKCVGDIFEFIISDTETGAMTIHQYDTLAKTFVN